MHAIILSCPVAIAMNLTVCKLHKLKRNGGNTQVVMITVHKFSYLKRVDFINV